jgi:hypothetical protein
MGYTMRKTPRSSFMSKCSGMGDITPTVAVAPVAVVAPLPPVSAPAPTVAPSTDSSMGLGTYVLFGGIAYLAYLMWKE